MQLALEQLGAAAIVRHAWRRTRTTGSLPMSPVPKSVSRPQIATISVLRHAELLLDAREQRGVALQHLPAAR